MADRISVLGLELAGEIGVYDHEKGLTQQLVVDVELALVSLAPAAEADRLAATVDYDEVARIAEEVVTERHHDLVETVADRIAARCLDRFDAVSSVTVRVDKPGAVPAARTVRIEVNRHRGTDGR